MSNQKKPKQKPIVSPKGVAVWPWLGKPDTKFDAEGVYKCDLRLDPDADGFKEFADQLQPILDEFVAEQKEELGATKFKKVSIADIFIEDEDEEGEETGLVILRTKMKAQFKDKKTGRIQKQQPKLIDASRNDITNKVNVYGGSTVKIAVMPRPYFMKSSKTIGLTLYIVAVQVIELVQGGSRVDGLFEDEDGFDGSDLEDVTDSFDDESTSGDSNDSDDAEDDEDF